MTFSLRSTRRRLPVVMYPAGDCAPGAAHALSLSRPVARLGVRPWLRQAWLRYPGRVLLFAGLLTGAAFALAPPPHRLPARRLSALPARPVTALPALTSVTARWDTDVNARPPQGRFVRFYRMQVTAYTPIPTRMEGGRYTSTRRDGRSAHGIAVDPDLIPLGSHLWVPGYGHAIADDIGGRIQGHHVDLRLQDGGRLGRWGVRYVRVYVLDDPLGPVSRLAQSSSLKRIPPEPASQEMDCP